MSKALWVVLVVGILSVAFGADDAETAAARALRDISGRLAILERHVYSNADWGKEAWEADRMNLNKLAGILIASAAGREIASDAEGKVDVWFPVRSKLATGEQVLFLYASRRFQASPTVAQLSGGDYSRFPYARFKGPVPKGKAPLLWDRWPTRRGRLVAWSTAGVNLLTEVEFQALMKQFKQPDE